jgi:hypothetical protein
MPRDTRAAPRVAGTGIHARSTTGSPAITRAPLDGLAGAVLIRWSGPEGARCGNREPYLRVMPESKA